MFTGCQLSSVLCGQSMQYVLTGCQLSSVLCGQHAVCIDRVSTVKCVVYVGLCILHGLLLFCPQSVIFNEIDLIGCSVAECSLKTFNVTFQVCEIVLSGVDAITCLLL